MRSLVMIGRPSRARPPNHGSAATAHERSVSTTASQSPNPSPAERPARNCILALLKEYT